MSDNAMFWVVWNPEGRNPTYRHTSFDAAKKEAERLAYCSPGQQFFVLQAVSLSKRVEVETTLLKEPVPF